MPPGQVQIIRLESQEGQYLQRGQTFHVQVNYDANPRETQLSGIGCQVTLPAGVTFVNANVQFNQNLFGGVTANGGIVSFQYADIFNTAWPGVDLPLDLMILELVTDDSFNGGNIEVGFSSAAAGYEGWSPGLRLHFGTFWFDLIFQIL